MSVYRRKYRIRRAGQLVTGQSKFFTIELKDPSGRLVRQSTKLTDRKSAEAAERRLRTQLERGGVELPEKFNAHRRRPIREHVDEFVGHQATTMKLDGKYCYIIGRRLTKICEQAGWLTLADVSVPSFESWRKAAAEEETRWGKRKAKTLNQYVDAMKEFLDWCKRNGRVASNLLLEVEKASQMHNPFYRRSATIEELQKLLAACSDERRRFYLFVLYCPLRRRTLEELIWSDLHLDDEPPCLLIRPETIKSKRAEKSALRKDVAAMMKEARGGAADDDLVFPRIPTVDDLRDDLKAAGIPFSARDGTRRLDLHAFRRTLIRLMKHSGVPLETASKALHHKDLATTRKYYDEDTVEQPMTDAVEKVPAMPMLAAKGAS